MIGLESGLERKKERNIYMVKKIPKVLKNRK